MHLKVGGRDRRPLGPGPEGRLWSDWVTGPGPRGLRSRPGWNQKIEPGGGMRTLG